MCHVYSGATSFAGIGDFLRQEQQPFAATRYDSHNCVYCTWVRRVNSLTDCCFPSRNCCCCRPEVQTSGVRTFADITSKTTNTLQQEPQIDSSSRVRVHLTAQLLLYCHIYPACVQPAYVHVYPASTLQMPIHLPCTCNLSSVPPALNH